MSSERVEPEWYDRLEGLTPEEADFVFGGRQFPLQHAMQLENALRAETAEQRATKLHTMQLEYQIAQKIFMEFRDREVRAWNNETGLKAPRIADRLDLKKSQVYEILKRTDKDPLS